MTLNLTLKKKWYEMIQSGGKYEEYREIKPYWVTRLTNANVGMIGGDFMSANSVIAYTFKPFKFVMFRNGYASDAPYMLREIDRIEIGEGRPEWGAEPGKKYFVIKLKQQ